MKLMKVGTHGQWVRIIQFSETVVGQAIAGLDSVGDVLDWDVVVKVVEMNE